METKNRRRKTHRDRPQLHLQNAEPGDGWSESIERSRDLIVNGLKTLQEETIRFVDQRLERDGEAMRDYRRCRNLPDILAVQQKWLTGVGLDWFEGGVRMGQLMQGMVSDEATEFGRAAETTFRETMEEERAAAE